MVTERREDTEGQSHKVDFEIVDMSGSTDVSQKKKKWSRETLTKMRWFEQKIINTRKAKEVAKNKGKDVVELKFEEDRPKTIKKVIDW